MALYEISFFFFFANGKEMKIVAESCEWRQGSLFFSSFELKLLKEV